jgi:hypothetical protein
VRRLVVAAALVFGVVAGHLATSAARPSPDEPAAVPASTTTRPVPVPEVTTVPTPTAGLLLVWVPGGLPAELVAALGSEPSFGPVTVVAGDTVQLVSSADAGGAVVDAPGDGRTIPIDAVAVDCASWSALAPIVDATAVCALGPDDALLGETSAELRRLGPGSSVVDDATIGAAELVLPRASAAAAGVDTDRYALVAFDGDRAAAEATVRSLTTVPMRVRGPGETPWLRHGDAVLPPSLLKSVFGEFSAAVRGGGALAVDPAWAASSLVTESVPLLGQVRCHGALLPALRGALGELEAAGLVGPLDRGVAGCWNPRTIAGTGQPSRHAWGAAFDLVPFPTDPDVVTSVVAVMERWGFTWGGRWVDPDPMHFEYLRPPS